MKPEEIHHIGYIVKNLDEALLSFEKLCGFKTDVVYEFAPLNAWNHGEKVDGIVLKIAMIEVSKGESVSRIELIEPLKGVSYHKEIVDEGKEGINHICFSVSNYDEYKEAFLNEGCEILFEAETEDELFGYRRCMYAEDKTKGLVLEIKEEPYFRK